MARTGAPLRSSSRSDSSRQRAHAASETVPSPCSPEPPTRRKQPMNDNERYLFDLKGYLVVPGALSQE